MSEAAQITLCGFLGLALWNLTHGLQARWEAEARYIEALAESLEDGNEKETAHETHEAHEKETR